MMNDEDSKLRETLESATRPGGDIPAGLDADVRQLRATWISLGRLLDGLQIADASLDAARTVSVSPTRQTTTGAFSEAEPPGRSESNASPSGKSIPLPSTRARRMFALPMALAAALLIAIGMMTMVSWRGHRGNRPAANLQVETEHTGAVDTADHASTALLASAASPTWDDSLDERIAAISHATDRMPANEPTEFIHVDAVGDRLEQIEHDVRTNTF